MALVLAVSGLVAVHILTLLMFSLSRAPFRLGGVLYPLPGSLLASAFILATVCSSGFWTMVARSSIGGLVFNISSQFLVVLGITVSLQRFKPDFGNNELSVAALILGASLIYSPLFLWLGWRKFARLELREAAFGEGAAPSSGVIWFGRQFAWLRCRPVGGVRNLRFP